MTGTLIVLSQRGPYRQQKTETGQAKMARVYLEGIMVRRASMAPSGKSAGLRGWPAKRMIHDTVPSSATCERPKSVIVPRFLEPGAQGQMLGEGARDVCRTVSRAGAGTEAGLEGKLA